MTRTIRTSHLLAAAVVGLLTFTSTAHAGRGGSAARIQNAVQTGSVDAIIAELERSERLICDACTPSVLDLLDHERYELREAAAWWIARRPALKAQLTERSLADLAGGDARLARNAADVLGTFRHPQAIDALAAAATRTSLGAEARMAAVRALGTIGHLRAKAALTAAMGDADATVRLAAVDAWAKLRHQDGAAPAVALIGDGDAAVRARAAAVVGRYREAGGRAALEAALTGDADPNVRRNAAWALGQLGDAASRPALTAATADASSLVRATAKAALAGLR
ncbi:MAG TPA: HEAT repeat domain-containing protein [Kofleriaceae bacterium]|nr:HEAT repeat domain-containing protein [Kofleriaceae bacterium]